MNRYAKHTEDNSKPVSAKVHELRKRKLDAVDGDSAIYRAFGEKAIQTMHRLLELLIRLRAEGKQVVGYRAFGKAATLLNDCWSRKDWIAYTVD